MMWFPFICLGIGVLVGLIKLSERISIIVDYIGNVALVLLMFSIGISIGADEAVISSVGIIGFQCTVIALCAMFFSVGAVVLIEKTILPLDRLKEKMIEEKVDINSEVNLEVEKKRSPLVWVIPACIVGGVIIGNLLISQDNLSVIDNIFLISLAILYVSVGIGLSQNKSVFQYVRLLGWKIIFLPIAILLGSLTGGAVAALALDINPYISIIAAGGMSYYSITGAFMTQTYGIHIGTYGFLVNVLREFFTVMLLPILIKISKGSPIAGGAAGNMDTMLVPVSKFVGIELGFVALVTGTILTFAVPILLPILSQILT